MKDVITAVRGGEIVGVSEIGIGHDEVEAVGADATDARDVGPCITGVRAVGALEAEVEIERLSARVIADLCRRAAPAGPESGGLGCNPELAGARVGDGGVVRIGVEQNVLIAGERDGDHAVGVGLQNAAGRTQPLDRESADQIGGGQGDRCRVCTFIEQGDQHAAVGARAVVGGNVETAAAGKVELGHDAEPVTEDRARPIVVFFPRRLRGVVIPRTPQHCPDISQRDRVDCGLAGGSVSLNVQGGGGAGALREAGLHDDGRAGIGRDAVPDFPAHPEPAV